MIKLLKRITINLIVGLILVIIYSPLYASDLAKEKRLREQVEDYVMEGNVIILKDGSREYLSIYMLSDKTPAKGSVIILHGRGFHPNWPELVYPLRTGLTEYGWNTLSIQMPVLSNDSTFYDYLEILPESHPRINAAIEFLNQEKVRNIILLAHSCGVYMGFDWLHKHPGSEIDAFIGIGMGSTDVGQPMLQPFSLEDIKIPVLDIRGDNDYPSVQNNAPRRWQRIKQAGNPKSQQRVVENAEHYFTDRNDALLEEVVEWLDTL